MRFLLRAIALFVVVMGAISAVRGLLRMLESPQRQRVRTADKGHLVQDPVCGTYVAQETALAEGGEYFCSEDCRRMRRL